MKLFRVPLIVIPVAVFILSACSSAIASGVEPEILKTEAILPLEGDDQTALEVDQEDDLVDVQENVDQVELEEIEATAAPLSDSNAELKTEEHSAALCEDPFTGTKIGFSTRGWETNFCEHSVPYEEFLSGGPPRDGIPPIDAPLFESMDAANAWLADREPVITLDLGGEARAYPLQILMWHEIVNDTVGGIPVVVTFCPLCNTALVFERPAIGGERLTFGTSGNLRNSDLVMWDRQTESWWQQFTRQAIVGDLTGTQLDFLPTSIVSWGDFKTIYPNGQVLSQDTGFVRNYGVNPYAGYDNVNQFPFLFDGPLDDRLQPMARVLGIELDGLTVAYPLDRLAAEAVINDILGEAPVVTFWKGGTASAVDTSDISQGRDVGTTGVYLRTVDDQTLTFSPGPKGTFLDAETGSTWDILGHATSGPLEGTRLTALPHHDTFWFAWAAFVPDGALADEE